MCDYSLHTAKSRPARVGDRLVTRNFTQEPEDSPRRRMRAPQFAFFPALNSPSIRSFSARGLAGVEVKTIEHTTAIFRQVNKSEPRTHHDALEFPDGHIELLTDLSEGQTATVLQLPAQPATPAEAQAQERVVHVWLTARLTEGSRPPSPRAALAMISPVCRAPLAERLCSVRSTSLTLLRCTPNIRARTFWAAVLPLMLAARAFRQAQPGILGAGFVATQKRAGDARATLCPSWRSETER